jgi:hypothetical protein
MKATALNRRQAVADDVENSNQASTHGAAARLQKKMEDLQEFTDLVTSRLRDISPLGQGNKFLSGPDGWDGPELEIERAHFLVSHNAGLDCSFRDRISHAFHVIRHIYLRL